MKTEIGCWVILIGFLLMFGIALYIDLREKLLFKKGRNPYQRICKKCGSVQWQYESNIIDDNDTWWEDMDCKSPECRCHRYTRPTYY